jgi:hypothetical protein
MAADLPVLDYGPPARPGWLPRVLRTLIIILIIAAGAALGAVIGDRLQPDRYIFNGSLSVSPSDAGTDVAAAKQAHIIAMRAGIRAAAATLNAQGTPISAAEFSKRMTLKDVPETELISVRFTSRSFDGPLKMYNVLITPYCHNAPGIKGMSGTLDRSVRYAAPGFVLGGTATGLMVLLRRRRLARRGQRGWVV